MITSRGEGPQERSHGEAPGKQAGKGPDLLLYKEGRGKEAGVRGAAHTLDALTAGECGGVRALSSGARFGLDGGRDGDRNGEAHEGASGVRGEWRASSAQAQNVPTTGY